MATLSKSTLFDPKVVNDLIDGVYGHSSIAALSAQKPVAFNGNKEFIFTLDSEVDIVAENELDGRAAFFEVKRDARRFDEAALRRKADAFLAATGAFRGYALEYRPLSLADM